MKGLRLSVWVVFALVAGLLMVPGQAAARATRIECSGTEVPLAVLDPGTWRYPGNNTHVRGMVSQYEEVSSNCPQIAGINTVTVNFNVDASFSGPMWGTSRAETDYAGGGIWEGTWVGRLNADGSSYYQAVSHGVSGSVAGLVMKLTSDNGAWTATILDPHGE